MENFKQLKLGQLFSVIQIHLFLIFKLDVIYNNSVRKHVVITVAD